MRTKFRFFDYKTAVLLLLLSVSSIYFANSADSLPNLVGDCESELFTGAGDWDYADDSTMMYDDGTHGDQISGDNIYTLKVEGVADTFLLTEVEGHQVVGTAGSWDPQFPGNWTGNVPIEFFQGDTVTFYFNRNVYTDGFVPESCIVYNSWMAGYVWPGPYYVVGDCQTEFGALSDWDQTDTTMKMNDSGINGDAAAGDEVYTFKGVCSAPDNYEFKVLNTYNSWRPQYTKEGFVWDFGTNLQFFTLSYSDTVIFETDVSKGRTKVTVISGLDTLKPSIERATAVSWDSVRVYFSESMDSTSAVDPTNYQINPDLTVLSVQFLSPSEYQLFLSTPKQIQVGTNYTLTVDTLVKDLAGNPMDTLYNTATFGIAPVTFTVEDTAGQCYPGFFFKGSFDTLELHRYDPDWGLGYLYEMYDDGTHGDTASGDHIWSRLLYLVSDDSTNTWAWCITDTFQNSITGNLQFWVPNADSQTLVFVPTKGISQQVTVTFSVDMTGQDPLSYAGGVSLEGSIYPLDWNPGNLLLSDPDNDTVYSVDIVFPVCSYPWVEYKYTKSTDGSNWVWESIGANRSFGIDDSTATQVLPTDCFNHDCGITTQDVKVTFIYDCSAFSAYIERGVWLVGSESPLAFGDPCPDTNNPMVHQGNQIYTKDILFPASTQRNVWFKAVIDAPINCWDEAELPGTNRRFIIDDSDTVQVLDTLYYDNVPPSGYLCGDANGDGRITGADATYVISYIYRGGPAPLGQGDVNLDGRITGADATYIINYIYRGGPPPCNPPVGYSPYSNEPASVAFSSPRAENGIIEIPVVAEFGVPLAFAHLQVTYDPTVLEPLMPDLTSRTEGLDLFCKPTLEAGRLKLGMLSLTADHFIQPGDGAVVMLRFKKLVKDADISSLRIEEAILVDEQSRELKTTVLGYPFGPKLPTIFSLSQNYPNPLSSGTEIWYALPKDAWVTIEVYNLLGEKVKTLVNRQEKAGYKVIHWDGTNASGGLVAPGVYFYRILTKGFSDTRKMIVVR